MVKSSLNSIPLILRSLIFLGTLGFLFSSTPEISEETRANGLDCLQEQLNNLQNRLEALEPVNMLALEELSKLEKATSNIKTRR